MGRMHPSGLLPKIAFAGLILTAAAGLAGCSREAVTADPVAVSFRPEGEAVTRVLGLYAGGARVGTITFLQQAGSWSGLLAGKVLLMSETAELTVGYQELRFPVRTVSRVAVLQKDLSLLAAFTENSYGSAPWVVSWERVSEKSFVRKERAGGSERSETVTLPAATPLTLEALPFLLGRVGLAPGETRGYDFFSLAMRKPVAVSVTLQGETAGVRSYRLSMWSMAETIWVGPGGLVEKEVLPLGIEARLPAAGEDVGVLKLETLLAQTAVPAVDVPDRFGDLAEADLVLEGVPALPVATRWQKVEAVKRGALLHLTRPIPPTDKESKDRAKAPMPLGQEAVLNLDSPYLAQIARQVTDGIDKPWDKAVAVGRWVYSNMGKTMRECTSALDALRAGEGECQSHALLASALCQASGVPTRFVSGVAYLPERGNYYYHAWLEVYAGEWIPIDPTLGRFPAGVDHIALVQGNYLDQFQMAPFLFISHPWRIIYQRPPGKSALPRDMD
jgi:hypothetical protein